MNFYIFMNVTLFLSIEDEEDPPQFEEITNQLQICNWLVKRPNILRLANEMLAAKTNKPSSIKQTSSISSDNVSIIEKFLIG
jgi:hypothetical protein